MKADLIIKNGKVFQKDRPWEAASVAVADGKIIAVGGGVAGANAAGPRSAGLAWGGGGLLPGVMD